MFPILMITLLYSTSLIVMLPLLVNETAFEEALIHYDFKITFLRTQNLVHFESASTIRKKTGL